MAASLSGTERTREKGLFNNDYVSFVNNGTSITEPMTEISNVIRRSKYFPNAHFFHNDSIYFCDSRKGTFTYMSVVNGSKKEKEATIIKYENIDPSAITREIANDFIEFENYLKSVRKYIFKGNFCFTLSSPLFYHPRRGTFTIPTDKHSVLTMLESNFKDQKKNDIFITVCHNSFLSLTILEDFDIGLKFQDIYLNIYLNRNSEIQIISDSPRIYLKFRHIDPEFKKIDLENFVPKEEDFLIHTLFDIKYELGSVISRLDKCVFPESKHSKETISNLIFQPTYWKRRQLSNSNRTDNSSSSTQSPAVPSTTIIQNPTSLNIESSDEFEEFYFDITPFFCTLSRLGAAYGTGNQNATKSSSSTDFSRKRLQPPVEAGQKYVECMMCCENAADVVFQPCGDRVTCNKCFLKLKDVNDNQGKKNTCPICREEITDFISTKPYSKQRLE